jgi:hypothetical protein
VIAPLLTSFTITAPVPANTKVKVPIASASASRQQPASAFGKEFLKLASIPPLTTKLLTFQKKLMQLSYIKKS